MFANFATIKIKISNICNVEHAYRHSRFFPVCLENFVMKHYLLFANNKHNFPRFNMFLFHSVKIRGPRTIKYFPKKYPHTKLEEPML
jgi:hypothetical protein